MRFPFFWRKIPFSDALAREYVEKQLSQLMQLDTSCCTLKRVALGTDDGIYKLDSDTDTVLLRFMRPRRDLQSDLYFENYEFLSSHGFPIPKILFKDCSEETLRHYNFIVVVEQFIEGEAYNGPVRDDPAIAARLAQLMAKFHSITRDAPGTVNHPLRTSYFDELARRIDHFQLKAIEAGLIRRNEVRLQQRWFEQWHDEFDRIKSFNLVHGDFNYSNVIIQSSGEIAVIDFNTTHFGLFELDLQECNRSLFGNAERARSTFFDTYFSITGPDAKLRYDKNRDFFDAFVYLEKASSNAAKAVKVRRGEKQNKLPYEEKSERYLGQLRSIMEIAENKCER